MKSLLFAGLTLLLGGLTHAQEVPLDAKQSYLKFTGHAFLHDFNGEAKEFKGAAHIKVDPPEDAITARIEIQTAKLTTFESTRDRNMWNWLEVDTNPGIVYELTKVGLIAGDPMQANRENPAHFKVEGVLILNKTREPLEAVSEGWREGKWLVVTGTTRINTFDYGLPEIGQFFLTVDKMVDIAFRLVFDLPPELQLAAQKRPNNP